jgi:hypothetical protein
MAFTAESMLDRSVVPPPGRSRLSRWATAAGVAGACAAGLAFVYAVDPSAAGNPYPRCLLKSMTGLDCPGCGGTRALFSLLHGDIAGALDHNILVFLIVPLFAYLAVRYAVDQFGVSLPAPRLRPWMGWAFAVFVIAFTVLRNIPGTPLHYFESGLA